MWVSRKLPSSQCIRQKGAAWEWLPLFSKWLFTVGSGPCDPIWTQGCLDSQTLGPHLSIPLQGLQISRKPWDKWPHQAPQTEQECSRDLSTLTQSQWIRMQELSTGRHLRLHHAISSLDWAGPHGHPSPPTAPTHTHTQTHTHTHTHTHSHTHSSRNKHQRERLAT